MYKYKNREFNSLIQPIAENAIKHGINQKVDGGTLKISTFEELGKTVGKDKKSGKLTYISLYGLEEARQKFQLLLEDCYAIVEKYNSKIFKEILDKLRDRILGV